MNTQRYQTEHVRALDGLRGYAALAVTFYHSILFLQPALIDRVISPAIGDIDRSDLPAKAALVLFDGRAAVYLFFTLSGCVLCHSLVKAASISPRSLIMFTLRRVLRLFPALIACMFLMWGIAQIYAAIGIATFPSVSAIGALKNALLIDTSVHGPSESIQIEAFATPFVLFFFLVYRAWSVPSAILVLVGSVSALEHPLLTLYLPNMNVFILPFVIGMFVSLPESRELLGRATTAQMLVILGCALLARHSVNIQSLPGLVCMCLLLGGLVGMLRWSHRTELHAFLENRVSQLLGRISYSYYLLNVVVLWVLWFSPAFDALDTRSAPVVGGLVTGAIAALLTVPLAYLSWRYCELPFIELGRRITRLQLPGRSHAA